MQSDGRSMLRVLSVFNIMDGPGVIMAALAAQGINVELLVSAQDQEDAINLSLVIAGKDLEHALVVLEGVKHDLEARAITYLPDVTVLTLFGPHLREKPRIPGVMFTTLASVGVRPQAISTSISSVSCVVSGPKAALAVDALSERFELPYKAQQRPKNW